MAALGACSRLPAAQWSIEPQLGLLVNYNSNLVLAPSGEQATEGTMLSLDSAFRRVTDNTEFDLKPHLDLQRYSVESALDATEASLQGSFAAHSERSSFSLSSGYERASTLTTELSDTGIIDASSRRETGSAGITLGRDLSGSQHVDLQGSYSNVIYPQGERLGLVGYRYPSAQLADKLSFSQLTSLTVAVLDSQLHAPLTRYDSRELGAVLTLNHELSMRDKMAVSVGATETTVQNFKQHGSVWDLHLTHSSELGQWDFDYGRSVDPSGRGYLIRRDTGSLTLSQNVAPELYATLTVQDVRNANLSNGLFLDVPHYSAADAGFDWHASPQVVVSVTAGAAQLREPVTAQQSHGWHTAVSTRWTPLPHSVSR